MGSHTFIKSRNGIKPWYTHITLMIDANKENKHEKQPSLFYCRFIQILALEVHCVVL